MSSATESKPRRELLNALQQQLIPALQLRGFEAVPLPPFQDAAPDRRLIAALPFGRLRRSSPRGFEFVEIQLAPRGRAAFRLSMGVAPLDGIEGVRGHIAGENVLVGWLGEIFHLYSHPRFRAWFAVRRCLWEKHDPSATDFHNLAASVVKLLPEVDQALSQGKAGPHIRRIVIKRS